MDFTLTLMQHPTFAGYCYCGIQQFDWTQSRDIKEKCAAMAGKDFNNLPALNIF